MKISTKKAWENPEAGGGPSSGRKAAARRKAPRKMGKNRLAGRHIFAAIRALGKLGGILAIAGSFLFLGVCAYNSEKFRLNEVAIYGCKESDPAAVEQIVRENARGNILQAELGHLQELLELEKWVRRAEIRRVLPSGLVVYISERVPGVILELDGQLMIADEEGILLDAYAPKYGKLDVPVFKGAIGQNPQSYRRYQEENTALIGNALDMLSEIESGPAAYAQKISEVDISDRNNLKIMLVDSTAEIHMGKGDYLNRFRALLESDEYQKFKNQNIHIPEIDLRYDNKIIFKGIRNVSGSAGK
ncbi:MAG: FtsQ-type POTRA domain-containing protein [Acidobacteria bacterium]|nr:FtsQ-type POTRA domain-containing protein [Acidobacteriota bacterium]